MLYGRGTNVLVMANGSMLENAVAIKPCGNYWQGIRRSRQLMRVRVHRESQKSNIQLSAPSWITAFFTHFNTQATTAQCHALSVEAAPHASHMPAQVTAHQTQCVWRPQLRKHSPRPSQYQAFIIIITIANETNILKNASFIVEPNINVICQRMANEVHKDVLPDDINVTAMESIKDEFGLKTSAMTTPGLITVLFLAMDSLNVRVQRRLLGLGTAPAQQKPRKQGCHKHDKDRRLHARCCNTSQCISHNVPGNSTLGWDIPPSLWVYYFCTC